MADKTTKIIEIEVELEGGEKVTKQFEKLSDGTLKAADSAEQLNAKFEDVYKGIEPLTTRMGEAEDRLYELALAGDTTSKEYNELLNSVGNYRKVQIETDLAVDGAATTLGQKLGSALNGATSGFAATQGAMALFGSESDALEESLLKVQSALAIQQGVDGLRTSYKELGGATGIATKVQTAFNFAMNLNPIVLIVSAVVAVVVALGTFTDVLDGAIQMFKDFTDFIGITNFEENKLDTERRKRAEDEIERIKEERKAREISFNKRQSQFDREIAMLEAEGKSSFNLRQQKIEDSIAIQKEKIKELNLQLQARKFITDALGDTALANTLTEETLKLQEELLTLNEDVLNSENQLAINTLNNNKKKTDSYKEHLNEKKRADEKYEADAQKALEDEINEEIALQQKLDEIQRENEDRFRTEQENEVLLVEEKYDTLQAMAFGNAEALEQIEIARLNELNDVKQKFAEEEVAIEEKKGLDIEDIKERNKQFAIDSAFETLDLISNITELFGKKGEKQAKKAFKVQKAAQIATTLGTTYLSATQAYASQFLPLPDPSSPVRGGIAAGLAVAAGLANVAKIASQKFEGGGATGSTSVGGSIPDAPSAPNFNVVGDSGVNQLASLQQQPTKAFVVSGDVTTAQALDRNRVQNATL